MNRINTFKKNSDSASISEYESYNNIKKLYVFKSVPINPKGKGERERESKLFFFPQLWCSTCH